MGRVTSLTYVRWVIPGMIRRNEANFTLQKKPISISLITRQAGSIPSPPLSIHPPIHHLASWGLLEDTVEVYVVEDLFWDKAVAHHF
jgi:hypothetical protein